MAPNTSTNPDSETLELPTLQGLLKELEIECQSSDPGPDALARLEALRHQTIETLLRSPAVKRDGPDAEALSNLVGAFVGLGLVDKPLDAGSIARIEAHRITHRGWVPVALLSAPAWQIPSLPRIEDQPYSFWPMYVGALFRFPPAFVDESHAKGAGDHYLVRLRELVSIAESNRGSSAVRKALKRYMESSDCSTLRMAPVAFAELLRLRARALTLATETPKTEEPIALPREGRRLRLGIIVGSMTDSARQREVLALAESLNPDSFQVVVYHYGEAAADLFDHLSGREIELMQLSGPTESDVLTLLYGMLDVVVCFTDALAGNDPVSVVALSRVAALQIAIDRQNAPYPLPEIDLAVTDKPSTGGRGAGTRYGRIPCNGVELVSKARRTTASFKWTRESLGVPSQGALMSSACPFGEITEKSISCWARILASAPNSRLLVYSYAKEDASPDAISLLSLRFNNALRSAGVDRSRVILANEALPSISDVVALLKATDLYLDSSSQTRNEAARLALEAGGPILAWEDGSGLLAGASLALHTLGMEGFAANDEEAYIRTAKDLCMEPVRLNAAKESVRRATESRDVEFDPVAQGEAFGTLVTIAYDEIALVGKSQFRADPSVIAAPSGDDAANLLSEAAALLESGRHHESGLILAKLLAGQPRNSQARELNWRRLSAQGRSAHAVDSVKSTVERAPQRPDLWLLLSEIYRGLGKRQEALQALETSLRLNTNSMEAWLSLISMADDSGDMNCIQDAIGAMDKLFPGHPRVSELTERYPRPLAPSEAESHPAHAVETFGREPAAV